MKIRSFLCALLVFALSAAPLFTAEPPYPTKGKRAFEPLPAGAVEPAGWLRDWALAARNGYTACMEDVHIDFKHAWAADFAPFCSVSDWPGGAWHLEGGGYWFDGLVRLGYALHDEELIALVKRRLAPVLDNAAPDGIGYLYWLKKNNPDDLATVLPDRGWGLWANAHFGHAMAAYAAASNDERAKRAMRFSDDSCDIRCITVLGYQIAPHAVPNACEDYRMTGDAGVAETLDRVFENRDVDWPEAWARYRTYPPEELKKGEIFGPNVTDSNLHGAVVNEILTGWAFGTLWTGKPEFLNVACAWARLLDEKCLQPHGALVEDEWFGPTGAYRGTETCSLGNEECRRIQLFTLTGNGTEADQIERLFFNAATGMVTRDFTKHVYFHSPNRIRAGALTADTYESRDRDEYRRLHDPRCCTAGLNKPIPYFIQHQWMTASDGGPAAILYAPCRLTTAIPNGEAVQIETVTDYPFGETIEMTVTPEKPVDFPLWLRIPAWCAEPSLEVNQTAVPAAADERGFVRVERRWSPGDRVTLRFPMVPRVERGIDRNIPIQADRPRTVQWGERPDAELRRTPFASVSLGPLLFVLPIPEKDENTPMENVFWQYALNPERTLDGVQIERASLPSPWAWQSDAPVKLKVKAVEAFWKSDPMAPLLPTAEEIEPKSEREIVLVPYGCAKLRIAMFPIVEEKP